MWLFPVVKLHPVRLDHKILALHDVAWDVRLGGVERAQGASSQAVPQLVSGAVRVQEAGQRAVFLGGEGGRVNLVLEGQEVTVGNPQFLEVLLQQGCPDNHGAQGASQNT